MIIAPVAMPVCLSARGTASKRCLTGATRNKLSSPYRCGFWNASVVRFARSFASAWLGMLWTCCRSKRLKKSQTLMSAIPFPTTRHRWRRSDSHKSLIRSKNPSDVRRRGFIINAGKVLFRSGLCRRKPLGTLAPVSGGLADGEARLPKNALRPWSEKTG